MLKLHRSKQSRRQTDTRQEICIILQNNRLQAEALTLQQRVELPIWHPEGMRGLHDDPHYRSGRFVQRPHRATGEDGDDDDDDEEVVADNPRPEEWLPQVMVEVCQDILHVLESLDLVRSHVPLYRD